MKRLPLVILVMMAVLGAVTSGCGGTHRYDSRLAAVDSLMHDYPDSALAVLTAIDTVSLTTGGDRAYRDLLLTQARYKAYITATSDSTINRALAYYRLHPKEREKLTRAFIYKGAVMEELGHPDSAMIYYKQAEANAAPTDYINLGYTKMRMGSLYNDYYTMNGQETVKYEEALEYFRLASDTVNILICLNNLGCMYRESNPDRAETLLMEASGLARLLNDTIRIAYNNLSLAVLYYHQGKYEDARHLFQEVHRNGFSMMDYSLFFTAANVYSKLGITDSAELFFTLAQNNRSGDVAKYNMYYCESLSVMALSKKDTLTSLRLGRESERIEDSLTSNGKRFEILNAEISHDKESSRNKQRAHHATTSSYQWVIVIVGVLLLIMALLAFRYYRRVHRYDRLISDLKQESSTQADLLISLQNNINNLKIRDIELKRIISSHIGMMRDVIEECYHTPIGPLAKRIKQIVKFQNDNKDLWEKCFSYIDMEHNNMMSETMHNFPQLDKKELMMIALTSMGYSCAQIAIVLEYSSSSGISTLRNRIAKKMGLDCSLGEYIEQFKSKN